MELPFVISCPHCKDPIIIYELNCRIFRHGVLKENLQQIDPHASKELCDFYIATNRIYGCGKPFLINLENIPEICDYI